MRESILETIASNDGTRRAQIFAREDGMFRVEIERWMPRDGDLEPAHWSRVGRPVILVDTVRRAREVAAEELAPFP